MKDQTQQQPASPEVQAQARIAPEATHPGATSAIARARR
jgi:hypothetical protein